MTVEVGDVGHVIVERTIDSPLVVRRADPIALISGELLSEIIEGRTPWVEFGEGVMWLGTEGQGCGRVGYEVSDPRFVDWLRGQRWELDVLIIRRIA